MTRKFACFLSHGLFIGQPVDELAAFLNKMTPAGIHFNVVGGFTAWNNLTSDSGASATANAPTHG